MDDRLRRALKQMSHRNWSELQEEWLGYVPLIEFDIRYPEPALWQLANFPAILGPISDGIVVEHVDGIREAIFRETLILVRKFNHSRSLTRIAAAQGRPTWASINAYEACFYGAKAFCYLLGFANIGRDSSFYLDAFFEVRLKRRKGLFEERFDMKLHRLPERFSHSVLWGLTKRLLDTTTFATELSKLKASLRKIDWEDFSKFRNSLLYDGSFWTKLDKYVECDLINYVSDIQVYRASSAFSEDEAVPFAREYFLVSDMLRATLSLMLHDLANQVPALHGEAEAMSVLD